MDATTNTQRLSDADAKEELLQLLARMADALEKQNGLLGNNTSALYSISMRIEDVMRCL